MAHGPTVDLALGVQGAPGTDLHGQRGQESSNRAPPGLYYLVKQPIWFGLVWFDKFVSVLLGAEEKNAVFGSTDRNIGLGCCFLISLFHSPLTGMLGRAWKPQPRRFPRLESYRCLRIPGSDESERHRLGKALYEKDEMNICRSPSITSDTFYFNLSHSVLGEEHGPKLPDQ